MGMSLIEGTHRRGKTRETSSFGSVSSLLRMQNSKRVIHPLIKHRLNAKLQKKINVADTIGTWKIVRGDTVFRLFCAVMGVGGGD